MTSPPGRGRCWRDEPEPERRPGARPGDREQAAGLAASLTALLESARGTLRASRNPLWQRISDHLGVDAREAKVDRADREQPDSTPGPDRPRGGDSPPDADGRRSLIGLYSGAAVLAADLEPVVLATDGATASAIKELMRRGPC